MTGWVSDKETLFGAADIFVLPSHTEAMPLAILEAASFGCAIVATRTGSIPEIIEDGVDGFLIEPGDIDGLTDRLARLIADETVRVAMGSHIRKKIIDAYSCEHCTAKVDQLYGEICDEA